MATGTLVPPTVRVAGKVVGKTLGAASRAVAEHFPAFGEFAERIAPGVLRRGETAAAATGAGLEWSEQELARLTPEQVEARFKDFHGRLYKTVDAITGETPVVQGTSLKTLVPEGTKSIPGFALDEQAAFQRMMQGESVSFADARRVKAAFARLAAKRQDPFSHQWATFRDAADDDIERFLETPGGADTGPAYRAVQQSYRQGKEAIMATQLYRRALDPSGRFNAAKFASNVRRWDIADSKGGSKLVHLVGQERANVLRDIAQAFGEQTEKSPTVAGQIAKRVGYAAPFVGAVGAEELYRHGQITPGRVAGAGMTLAALHPAGRALLSTLAGQGAAAGARHELDPSSDFIKYLGSQGFTP
jgi:hypothetical protein